MIFILSIPAAGLCHIGYLSFKRWKARKVKHV